ncbi:MAG: rhomboid family intramembrane serine protease [Deltaproteobacteria bacterium]|nr:rhomboid family intramembrane serine protease [Deltaproteobacteria bacterium]
MLWRLGSSTLIRFWIVSTLGASIIAALDGGWLASWAALVPSRIWRGEVWRLVTWSLVESGPMALVMTCLAIYKFGGELAVRWGDRRLRRFVVTIVVVAAVVTTVLATVTGNSSLWRCGGWAVTDALVIAWARQFPNSTLVLYGLVALRGRELIRLTVAVAVVFALYVGPITMAPELVACLCAAFYPAAMLRR